MCCRRCDYFQLIVNVIPLEVPPPGESVNTDTCAAPGVKISAAGTVALSWVALT
jgi:hypothetical protein